MPIISTFSAGSVRGFGQFRSVILGGVATVSVDPFFNYVTTLLPGTGTNNANNNVFLDSSNNNFTITRNGNTTQGTFSPFGTGWSNYFDGGASYLSIPNNTAFVFGTGDFTVEAWVFLTASPGADGVQIVGNHNSGVVAEFIILVNTSSTIFYTQIPNNPSVSRIDAATIPLNSWTHLAMARSSGTMKAFINGIEVGSVSNTLNLTDPGVPVTIGADNDGSIHRVTGYISNVRIVKGTALYTSNFMPSSSPLTAVSGTSLLTCHLNYFKDDSTNNFAVTRTGGVSVQKFSQFTSNTSYSTSVVGGSGVFDGTGDYISIVPNDSTVNWFAGNYTVEYWVYPNAFASSTNGGSNVFGQATPASSGEYFSFGPRASGTVVFYYYNGAVQIITAGTINTGAWTHLAAVYNKTTNTMSIYINGALSTSATITGTPLNGSADTGAPLLVGAGASAVFNGCISNLRILRGTALYPSNFTPPTAPLTAIANTSLLCNFTNAGITDSARLINFETVGDAKISTAQSKFGGSSIAFDGTGDVLYSPNNPNLDFGGGDFTVEAWIYFSSLPSNNYVVIASYGNSTASQRWLLYYDTRTSQSSPGLRFSVLNASNALIADVIGAGTSGWAVDTWYHVAITRNGNSWRLFRDGVQNGSTVTDADAIPNVTSTGLVIGAEPDKSSGAFNGYIDDFRITKGIARYTANFTAPTEAFATIGRANTPNPPTTIEYLIIAGGGGGGSITAGGGGAGGVLMGTGYSVVPNQAYNFQVGAGGGGAVAVPGTNITSGRGANGTNSVLTGPSTLTAIGGGGGGSYQSFPSSDNYGNSGGSGGGGAIGEPNPTARPGGSGTPGQGFEGGTAFRSDATVRYYGGGGGGGGSAGVNAPGSSVANGGIGIFSSITGSNTAYAGGGGGGNHTVNADNSVSGKGGGGYAPYGTLAGTPFGAGNGGIGTSPSNAFSGNTNSGGGGGGGGYFGVSPGNNAGGAGGSGVIIIRYPNTFDFATFTAGMPEITDVGGYKVYKWNSSGSITF